MRRKFFLRWIGVLGALAAVAIGPLPGRAQTMTALKVGDRAPDFELKDQNNKPLRLADLLAKKNVVLAFYVFAFTGG
ncbi:MAG: redoxin domain-containing protein [Acidobacteria bacterium]|nr:redoxin domain-containing protein [Acidobacteriota bacterium]